MAINKSKRLKPRKIIFGGMFIISLIVIMISVSFSWFYSTKSSKVNEFTIDVGEAENLVIRENDGTDKDWNKKLEVNFEDSGVIDGLKAVCGNGSDFYKGKFALTPIKDGSNVLDYTLSGYEKMTAEEINAGVFDYEFSFYIESDFPLYLTPDSVVRPSENAKESAYGDFSSGNISGAIRVAIFQRPDNNRASEYNLKCIWIPDTTTELIQDENGTFSVNPEGSVENEYIFLTPPATGNTPNQIKIPTNGESSGNTKIGDVTYIWGDITENIQIGTLAKETQGDFKIVVWVDGGDRECHNALLDGKVYLNLKFSIE